MSETPKTFEEWWSNKQLPPSLIERRHEESVCRPAWNAGRASRDEEVRGLKEQEVHLLDIIDRRTSYEENKDELFHRAHDAAREQVRVLRGALRFVKSFFTDLEDALEPDDPLHRFRNRYHAPVHAKIDAALALTEAPKSGE